ncbi:MAG: hypothetical protein IVW54_07980 [Candidatus Binataceae bacterium]|nr:hypothetical protein [Candidatus Binataceae bacterium]
MKSRLNAVSLGIASLAFVTAMGCFSYHKSEEVTKPATAADQPTTTTTTTQSNDGTVHQHSTTTYAP